MRPCLSVTAIVATLLSALRVVSTVYLPSAADASEITKLLRALRKSDMSWYGLHRSTPSSSWFTSTDWRLLLFRL